MDQQRFDQLARLLGASGSRRSGLKAALGGLLGVGAGAAAAEAEARRKDRDRDRGRKGPGAERRRRHECGPDAPCPTGFACEKQGRKRRCSCASGILCAGTCCAAGQVCRDGACVVPVSCIAPGEPCKGVGRPCCAGRTCSSGQGGEDDVACYVHKTGACQSTADCVYGTACIDGRCGFDVPPPAALGAPCNLAIGQQCATPGAVCMDYDGPDAPSGTHCVLPLRRSCAAASECESHACGYANGPTIAAGCERACAGSVGHPCGSDGDCLVGAACVGGTCREETACDVCPGGGCAFSSIVAAYAAMPAGSTITIAPGTYNEPSTTWEPNVKNMTFRRCGLSGTVLWKRADSSNQAMVKLVPSAGPATVTFVGIDFDARGSTYEALYLFSPNESYRGTLRLLDCRFENQTKQPVKIQSYADLEVCDSVFANNSPTVSGDAGGIETTGDAVPLQLNVRVVRSRFTGNSVERAGGGIKAAKSAVTLIDTEISGNTVRSVATSFPPNYIGAGIWLDQDSTLSMQGATMVTGNVSPAGGCSGIGITAANSAFNTPAPFPAAPRVSGVSSANVTGNTPADIGCALVIRRANNWAYAPVSCDEWCLPNGTDAGHATLCPLCCSGACPTGTTCG